MLENLPEEQMKIRNRLRDRIARQPTVEGQVESWESILSTFFEVFDGLIGNLAARAVLSRSIAMASRDYPRLAAFTMTDHGPDTSRLLESLADGGTAECQELLVAAVDGLFLLLHGLLGNLLLPLLLEVEAGLPAGRNDLE